MQGTAPLSEVNYPMASAGVGLCSSRLIFAREREVYPGALRPRVGIVQGGRFEYWLCLQSAHIVSLVLHSIMKPSAVDMDDRIINQSLGWYFRKTNELQSLDTPD